MKNDECFDYNIQYYIVEGKHSNEVYNITLITVIYHIINSANIQVIHLLDNS